MPPYLIFHLQLNSLMMKYTEKEEHLALELFNNLNSVISINFASQ